jgi:DNA-directed RNA polymerase alpha subunit
MSQKIVHGRTTGTTMAAFGVGQRVRVADGRSLYNGFIGRVVSVIVPGNRGSYVSYSVKLEFWDKPLVRLGQKQLEALADKDRDVNPQNNEETTSESSDDDRRTVFDARATDLASHAQDSLDEERTATDFTPTSLPRQSAGTPPIEPDSQIHASSDSEPTPVLDRSLAQRLVDRGITDIRDLSLQPRTYNALRNSGIRTVFDLARTEERDLLRLHQFGFKSLVELRMRLAAVVLADDSIYCLNLSTFVVHALVRNGIRTISGARALSDEQLFRLHGFGHSSLIELQEKLETYTPREPKPSETGSESVISDGETIYLLNLKPRTLDLLWRNRIRTISTLTAMTDDQLLSIRGFGPRSLVDVKSRLNRQQLSLEGPDQESEPSSPALSSSQSYQESICRIRELASLLCQHFANQGLHEQLTLPEPLQNAAWIAFDESCRTLLDLHQLTEQPDLNSTLADRPYAYSRGYALKETLDWLETAVRYHTIDDELASFVAGLNKRETAIFLNRFRLDGALTLEAIGSQFGITRERVRQIQKMVKARLVRRVSLTPFFYSRAALLLLKRMDDEEGVTFESWKRKLIDTGYLDKDESLDLLIAINLARVSSTLFLSKEQVASMRLGLPHGIRTHVKPLP